MTPLGRLAIGLGLLALPSCVSFNYSRLSLNEPRPIIVAQELADKSAELQVCLDALGAPLEIWETADGFAATYGWIDQAGWSFTASISVRAVPVRFNYVSESRDLFGIVLLFSDDAKLRLARSGYLSEITADLRRRPPQPVED